MEIPAIIERVIFRNNNGFAVLAANLNAYSSHYTKDLEDIVFSKCKKNEYDNFIITVGMLEPNENPVGKQYIFIGDFVTSKYGDQFKSEFCYQDKPNTTDGLRAYLQTLPNIKEVRSAAIIERFGLEGTIDILDNNPNKLIEINGITERRIPPIKAAWDREKALRELYAWLSEHNVQPKLGRKIYQKWGSASLSMLQANPYQLIEIEGIGFVTADNIAHKIMDSIPISFRTKACMQYLLIENLHKNSNLCMPLEDLKNALRDKLAECDKTNGIQSPIEQHVSCMGRCIKDNLKIFTAVKEVNVDGKTVSGIYVYLKPIWEKEKYIAEALNNRRHLDNREKEECTDEDIESSEKDITAFSGRSIHLDDCQKAAIQSAFEHKLTVITGGGGTGKSTICRCIFYLAQEKGLSVRMMSPTGKAAQVLTNKTKCGAATIHRSLRMKPDNDYPGELIKEDIIIIDEMSMVGIDTMFAIMAAMAENPWGNIIFVGDCNQLPSVSPGNFLSDIMNSGCANVVKLDKIHRQDENSYISVIANKISNGIVTSIPEQATDIKWHESRADEFEKVIAKAVKTYLDKGNDIADLQVMAPKYKGFCGVNKTNQIIQDMMAKINNSEDKILQKDLNKFYLNDRVIQTKNDYDKDVFNGDMGIVAALGELVQNPDVSDKKDRFVTVNFYGEEKTYFEDDIDQLRVAWCITVHKYQGSQSPNIFFVMSQEANMMMTKELVYTAFTRAEKHLDIYGNSGMLQLAPTRSSIRKRYTNLNKIIKELRENRKLLHVLEEKTEDKGQEKSEESIRAKIDSIKAG